MYDSSCVIPVCVSLFASARRFLYDPMNWMSDWPDQFFRAFATVFTDAVWPMILSYVILLFFFFFSISFFNMCTFYFAHNMFDKDSLACVDVFFPSTVSVPAQPSMGN